MLMDTSRFELDVSANEIDDWLVNGFAMRGK